MTANFRTAGLATALAAGLLLSGCSATYRNHGYVPPDSALQDVQVGQSTQAEVAQAVGRPTAAGVLDAGGWYYVQSRFRHFAYRAPEEIDREVVAISFNDGGVVTNVERFGLQEGNVVPISRRVTESNVQGIGFLQQLFGNLGNFNPAGFFGEDATP
ncbi:Outer membrane protein assembly factor BamE, lipoprotein component of the BamABCDE complex [Tranquillimonas rosea]|uniref:Outer membrane protein assembly factor BamE, lipoprotein component of the BamABCDE complex n=1 Tax=Tranquillimonas rosea TaxID=641238 RepID=A0A1H9TIB7_9RHOB|nr:outer membrane protein assembly factor BamE [Tranquillimonas rosea]SER96922.1 Outer membrane protein assembly factor BamE, lipoprotein component of the BamABCDE complex [Tranquillimonas rosea]